MKFEKYHGIGNDFIIVDYRDIDEKVDLGKLAIKLCNRFTGIGSDGLVIAGSKENEYQMRYYDPTGYRDQMCGNAIRCLSLYYINHGFSGDEIKIQTDDGLKIIKIVSLDPFLVKVNMQSFDWTPANIPVITTLDRIHNEPFKLKDGSIIKYTAIKFGPAHVVIYVNEFDEKKLLEIINQINKPSLFPEEACYNFAKVVDRNNIELKTWERGIGFTLACGTGSCATAAISLFDNLTDNKVNIHQALGTLTIEKVDNVYHMQGTAEFVYKGEVNIN